MPNGSAGSPAVAITCVASSRSSSRPRSSSLIAPPSGAAARRAGRRVGLPSLWFLLSMLSVLRMCITTGKVPAVSERRDGGQCGGGSAEFAMVPTDLFTSGETGLAAKAHTEAGDRRRRPGAPPEQVPTVHQLDPRRGQRGRDLVPMSGLERIRLAREHHEVGCE